MPNRCFILLTTLSLITVLAGCAATHPQRTARDPHGRVFFFDGAGGGGVLTNWGGGVKRGLREAGYRGAFENHPWQTGLGALADQTADVDYKRKQAREVAAEIIDFQRAQPDAPVHLVGLSAGTAIAAFALEALPAGRQVDTVVLLGSSLNQHYDLTEALRHVRNRVYVFTSQDDSVLRFGASTFGTADREFCGACSAGLGGFHLPQNPSDATRQQYNKIINIEWKPEFARFGNLGGHTGAVNARFVEHYVAPLLDGDGPMFVYAAQSPHEAER